MAFTLKSVPLVYKSTPPFPFWSCCCPSGKRPYPVGYAGTCPTFQAGGGNRCLEVEQCFGKAVLDAGAGRSSCQSAEDDSIQYIGRQIELHDGVTMVSEQTCNNADRKQPFKRLVSPQPDLEKQSGSKLKLYRRPPAIWWQNLK